MKYTSKTEYGLVCMILMARAMANRISIKEMSLKEKYPIAYIEKILQALRQADLVKSYAGKQGGYSLARKADEITLKEIIEALEGETFETFCKPKRREDIICNHFCLCGIKPVWKKSKELLDAFFDAITLEMLTKNEFEIRQHLPKILPQRNTS